MGIVRECRPPKHSRTTPKPLTPAIPARASSASSATFTMTPDRHMRVSKALSFVLRHGAPSQGVALDAEGYGHIRSILESPAMSLLHTTEQELQHVVRTDGKQRFEEEVVLHQRYLRAVQGHSIRGLEADSLHTRVTEEAHNLPAAAIHGTYMKHFGFIKARGLLAGGVRRAREHIHFQTRPIGDPNVTSGMRDNCEIAVYIDLPAALRDGIPFYLSANDVLLTPGADGILAPRYITKIEDIATGQRLF